VLATKCEIVVPKNKTVIRNTSDLSRHFIDVFGVSASKKEALLKGTDIGKAQLSGRKDKINAKSQQALMENITKLNGPGWVFRYSSDLNLRFDDELGKAMLHAPNLGEAFDLLAQFGHMSEPAVYYEQFKLLQKRHVIFDIVFDVAAKSQTVLDVISVSSYRFVEQVWNPDWRGVEAQFPFGKPKYDQLIKHTFACPVRYGKKRYAFVFDEDICMRPNPQADRDIYTRAVSNLYKHAGHTGEAIEFVQATKNHLNLISDHRPNAEETARALRVSRRTLNRRLTQAGTSYRQLLDQSLKARAYNLLSETRLTHREIAERLGYNDQTSFSRALKRWRHQDEIGPS